MLTKVIDTILDIDSFEKQCVIIKYLLQSERLKQHMVIIDVEQSLRNSGFYGHICLGITQKLYNSAGKCDDQQQYKAILEAAMVSTPELLTNNIPMSSVPYVPVKQPNARKSLRQFSETLNFKPNNDVCRLCVAK